EEARPVEQQVDGEHDEHNAARHRGDGSLRHAGHPTAATLADELADLADQRRRKLVEHAVELLGRHLEIKAANLHGGIGEIGQRFLRELADAAYGLQDIVDEAGYLVAYERADDERQRTDDKHKEHIGDEDGHAARHLEPPVEECQDGMKDERGQRSQHKELDELEKAPEDERG